MAADAVGASLAVIETANNAVSASRALEEYADDHELPRVIIAGNNPLALGAMRFLHERDIAIPSRVAVVAYDEFDWAPVVDPPLTVINEDSGRLGVLAAETLLSIIADQSERDSRGQAVRPQYRATDSKEARASLIVRRSCGCLEDERTRSAKVSSTFSEG
jgi:LacI family transcriptional regulator